MNHDDFEFEPQPGLPAPLPEGERLLWQGGPDWQQLAIHAYHARKAAVYFALLIVWRIAIGLIQGHAVHAIAASCCLLLVLGAAAAGILTTLAYFSGRAAIYSITTKRILLRHGVAVPLTLNIPFKVVESADLKLFGRRRGEITLRMFEDQRVGYLITWPYLRPGALSHPQPCLRALAEAPQVAEILSGALSAYSASVRPELAELRQARAMSPLPVRAASAA